VSLHHGDCLELMPKLPDRSVDVILADLPFGITDLAWDRRLDLDALWLEYRRLLRERGAVLLFATQPFATDLINAARKWFRYEWIWLKPRPNGFLNAHKMPMRAHEQVLVFYPRLPHYRPPGLVRCHHPKRGNVGGKGVWQDGKWSVSFTRSLVSPEKNDVALKPGSTIAVAFAVWDGSLGDRNGQKMVTNWYNLHIGPK